MLIQNRCQRRLVALGLCHNISHSQELGQEESRVVIVLDIVETCTTGVREKQRKL
jgi:hypothetical protein